MASIIKPWDDGGSLSVIYYGDGDGSAFFSSDVAEGLDREMPVTFVDSSRKVMVSRTVRQAGMREEFEASDNQFVTADNEVFCVKKNQ